MGKFTNFYQDFRVFVEQRMKNGINVLEEGASPKQKIQQYKITNPFLIHTVFRYGDLFDWGKINSKEDIVQSVRDELLPKIKERMKPDHPKSVLFDPSRLDIQAELENVRAAHPEQYDTIRNTIEQEGEEATKKKIGDIINTDKRNVLDEWWFKTGDTFGDDPVKRYIVLRNIFDSTTKKDKKTPKPYRYFAVKELLTKIGKQPTQTISLNKTYETALSEELLNNPRFEKKQTPDGKVWINIPSQQKDPENFEENVETLMGLSCNLWCISGKTMATRYLQGDGNFYLLLDKENPDKPTALMAVRVKNGKIQEVRGEEHQQGFDPEEQQENLDYLISITKLDRYEMNDWINKERGKRNLEPIKDASIEEFKQNTFKRLIDFANDFMAEKWEEVDSDDKEGITPSEYFYGYDTTESLVEDYFDRNGLVFMTQRPMLGLRYDDVGELAEYMGDDNLGYATKIFDGSGEVDLYDYFYTNVQLDDDEKNSLLKYAGFTMEGVALIMYDHDQNGKTILDLKNDNVIEDDEEWNALVHTISQFKEETPDNLYTLADYIDEDDEGLFGNKDTYALERIDSSIARAITDRLTYKIEDKVYEGIIDTLDDNNVFKTEHFEDTVFIMIDMDLLESDFRDNLDNHYFYENSILTEVKDNWDKMRDIVDFSHNIYVEDEDLKEAGKELEIWD